MSFRRVRILATAGLAVASAISCGAASARDYRKPTELAPLHHDNDHEIIFEMEPLHPVKGGAVAQPQSKKPEPVRSASKPTKESPLTAAFTSTAPNAEKAPVATPAPKPAEQAKTAEAPKSADAAPVTLAPPAAQAQSPALDKQVEAVKDPAAEKATEAAQQAPEATEQPVISSEQQPVASTAQPVAEASQPTPLPLDEALHPDASKSAEATPADKPISNENVHDGPAKSVEAPVGDTAQVATPQPTAAPAVDTAQRIATLLNQGMKGPVEVRVADRATIFLPAGKTFVSDDSAKELAKLAGFDWRPTMRGLITPTGDKLNWLAPVEVLEDGYIKSDVALDGDKLLSTFAAGLPEVNAQRVKAGQSEVELSGWLSAPALDAAKHRLSACVNVVAKGGDGDKYFNCESWALGRDGAIKVSLAEGAEEGERLKVEARQLADTIVFDHGKAYEEVDLESDRIAPYTVAELLTSDVTAKSLPALTDEGATSLLDSVLSLWHVVLIALLGVAAALFWLRRQDAASMPPVVTAAPKANTSGEAPKSLFARLLPSLYAKFADKRSAGGQEAMTNAPADKPITKDEAEGGLLGKIAGLRNKSAQAPAGESADAASALKALASRMRRSPVEEPVEKVDVARALRGATRPLPGAAPSPVEPQVDSAPAALAPAIAEPMEERASAAPVREPRASAVADDSFGLVEPGDREATSAAMHARESLRHANG